MREEAVDKFLARAGSDWTTVNTLVSEGKLTVTEYKNNKYFMRSLPRKQRT